MRRSIVACLMAVIVYSAAHASAPVSDKELAAVLGKATSCQPCAQKGALCSTVTNTRCQVLPNGACSSPNDEEECTIVGNVQNNYSCGSQEMETSGSCVLLQNQTPCYQYSTSKCRTVETYNPYKADCVCQGLLEDSTITYTYRASSSTICAPNP